MLDCLAPGSSIGWGSCVGRQLSQPAALAPQTARGACASSDHGAGARLPSARIRYKPAAGEARSVDCSPSRSQPQEGTQVQRTRSQL